MNHNHIRMHARLLCVMMLVVLLLSGAAACLAQDTRATLSGKVTDPSGAVIVGASVAVTSVETGVTQTTKTDATGDWTVHFLVPGHYTSALTRQASRRLFTRLLNCR